MSATGYAARSNDGVRTRRTGPALEGTRVCRGGNAEGLRAARGRCTRWKVASLRRNAVADALHVEVSAAHLYSLVEEPLQGDTSGLAMRPYDVVLEVSPFRAGELWDGTQAGAGTGESRPEEGSRDAAL